MKQKAFKSNSLKILWLKKEPFLNPSLTIHELADQVGIPVRELPLLISHHVNQHFFDFVNEYQVKKAITILKDPTKKEYTVWKFYMKWVLIQNRLFSLHLKIIQIKHPLNS